MITVTIPTGESRTAEPDETGSYACPWCGGCVPSPEHPTVVERGLYPDYLREAWEAHGCGNPGCFARTEPPMPVSEIERIRQAAAARRQEEAASRARHESAMQRLADDREREAATWVAAKAEAERRGACLTCLRRSDWRSFKAREPSLAKRVRFVRHRGRCPHERPE